MPASSALISVVWKVLSPRTERWSVGAVVAAIVLGVAFVAGSLMFTDSLNRAFSGIMNGTVGDATVRATQDASQHSRGGDTRTIGPDVLAEARSAKGVAQVDGVVSSMSATVSRA